MKELERLELAIRQIQSCRNWETSTVAEFINDLIENLNEKNEQIRKDEDILLELERKT